MPQPETPTARVTEESRPVPMTVTRDYIVQSLREAASMYEEGANEFVDKFTAEILTAAAGFLREIGTPISGERTDHDTGVMYAAGRLLGHAAELSDKPPRFTSTPEQVDAWLRVHFAEDVLLRYQLAVGDRAVREAVADIKADADREQAGPYQSGLLAAIELVDPEQDGGPYPSALIEFPTR